MKVISVSGVRWSLLIYLSLSFTLSALRFNSKTVNNHKMSRPREQTKTVLIAKMRSLQTRDSSGTSLQFKSIIILACADLLPLFFVDQTMNSRSGA